ncbi:polymer-forming cytoskeletal protein [Kiritimatiellaeota bacterium B1221]|nr:polymer-forming cytoskeletal protein [Kiritimatiellaeota bacterium B1221]
MASKKTKVVDGYTAIRAAQEAARHGRGDPLRPDPETSKPKSTSDPRAGSRIGRSVMPTKREVICPECDATSSIVGKVDLWVCTHCRHRMKLQDLKIPEGDWQDEVEVGGTVTILPGAKLKGGKITANDIILQGSMEGVEIRACHKLTILAGAKPDWVRLKMMDLELGPGVNITPGKPIEARHLLLHGKFSGNAVLKGMLTIHADGDFSGQLKAAGLQVEEGGGFRAQLDVKPENAPPPPKPKARAPAKPNPKLRPPPPKNQNPPRPKSK